MKDKMLIAIILILAIVSGVFWFQKTSAEKKMYQTQRELRVGKISQDSLVKVSDGYYQKLVADTLTSKQLKKLAEDIVDLKNRKPIYVTKTIIQPVEVLKETDSVTIVKDSIFIKDYYPNKENPFLKYTNRTSLKTEKGISNFKFEPIELSQVVTKKEDGLYQVDFKGPDFLEVKSMDIQTEPIKEHKPDNWGTLIGIEYGQNLDTKTNVFEINAYQRYKKFYIGIAVSTDQDLKGGTKLEF
jgi:hypothetical protein